MSLHPIEHHIEFVINDNCKEHFDKMFKELQDAWSEYILNSMEKEEVKTTTKPYYRRNRWD